MLSPSQNKEEEVVLQTAGSRAVKLLDSIGEAKSLRRQDQNLEDNANEGGWVEKKSLQAQQKMSRQKIAADKESV